MHCVVYHCSPGLTSSATAKFFSGITQTGSWAVLDDICAVPMETLAILASQLDAIRQSLLTQAPRVLIDGQDQALKPSVALATTTSAPRITCPGNFLALFRPIALTVPDTQTIVEVTLAAEGFHDAKRIATKLCQLQTLCRVHLSCQSHYAFGLREVVMALHVTVALRRNAVDVQKDTMVSVDEVALVHTAVETTRRMLHPDDELPFTTILTELFPGGSFAPGPRTSNDRLRSQVNEAYESAGMEVIPTLVEKTLQLHAASTVRQGIALVGPAGSGEPSSLRVIGSYP